MMQIRCQWCGWTYTMPRDALLYAVAKAQAEKAIHHVENCPKCRHALKIQVNELKRRIPPNTPLPEYIPPEKEIKEMGEIKGTGEEKEIKETVEKKEIVEAKEKRETVEVKQPEEKKAAAKKVEEVKPKKAEAKKEEKKPVEKKATTKAKTATKKK